MKTGSYGELLPVRGFSRVKVPAGTPIPAGQSIWRSHDSLIVVSSLEEAELPGSGHPPLVGPTWLVSVSRRSGGRDARCRVVAADLTRVVECFAMPAFDEDNHHPGIARHLFCPVDPQYRNACECKTNEIVVADGDYEWTTGTDDCRGCEYERRWGQPCPRHKPA